MSETDILQSIRLALGKDPSIRLSRNNTGKLQDKTGRWVQFGIFSPGGADLIGWKSVCVTQSMVGKTIAVFLAVEVKAPGGRRSPEQENFIRIVTSQGGLAGFAESVSDAERIVNGIPHD